MYNVISKNSDICYELDASSWGYDEEKSVSAARKLVVALYDSAGKYKSSHHCLNDMRVKMCKSKDTSLARLPPCEDSFKQHVKRSVFQTNIWVHAHDAVYASGKPEEYEWVRNGNSLEPVYFEGQSASQLLDGFFCRCAVNNACSTLRCPCSQHNMPCIEHYIASG